MQRLLLALSALTLAFKVPLRVPRLRIDRSSYKGRFVYKTKEASPSFVCRFQSDLAPETENMINRSEIDPFESERISLEKQIEVNVAAMSSPYC